MEEGLFFIRKLIFANRRMKKLAALILVSFALVQPNFGFAQTQRIQYPAALANTYFESTTAILNTRFQMNL